MEEFFERNSELNIEFSKYVLEHPELDEIIPEDAVLTFLPEYDEDLKKFNLTIVRHRTLLNRWATSPSKALQVQAVWQRQQKNW